MLPVCTISPISLIWIEKSSLDSFTIATSIRSWHFLIPSPFSHNLDAVLILSNKWHQFCLVIFSNHPYTSPIYSIQFSFFPERILFTSNTILQSQQGDPVAVESSLNFESSTAPPPPQIIGMKVIIDRWLYISIQIILLLSQSRNSSNLHRLSLKYSDSDVRDVPQRNRRKPVNFSFIEKGAQIVQHYGALLKKIPYQFGDAEAYFKQTLRNYDDFDFRSLKFDSRTNLRNHRSLDNIKVSVRTRNSVRILFSIPRFYSRRSGKVI